MASDGSDTDGSDGSDINIKSALPKTTNKKTPNSPSKDLLEKKQDKKLSTKVMMTQALEDLHTKKGVSLFAVKKYIAEKYSVDPEKLKFFIKKALKSALEEGTVIQTKGMGVSGSFKLAPVKKTKKEKTEKVKKTEKAEKIKDPENKNTLKEKSETTNGKSTKVKEKSKKPEGKTSKAKMESQEKPAKSKKQKSDSEKKPKENVQKEKQEIIANEKKEKMPKDKKGKISKEKTEKNPKEKKEKVPKEKVKKLRIPAHLKTPKKISKSRNGLNSSILKPPKMKPMPEI